MNPETVDLLEDIASHALSIREFTQNHTFETYCNDLRTRLAVERAFEIIGEALTRIKRTDPSVLSEITESRSIVSFRNILAHAYDHVEDKIVWGVIQTDLQKLSSDVNRLLSQ